MKTIKNAVVKMKEKTFVDANGKEVTFIATYINVDGAIIAVKPIFKSDKAIVRALYSVNKEDAE